MGSEKNTRIGKKGKIFIENRKRFSTEIPGSPENCRQFSGDKRKKKAACGPTKIACGPTQIAGNLRGTKSFFRFGGPARRWKILPPGDLFFPEKKDRSFFSPSPVEIASDFYGRRALFLPISLKSEGTRSPENSMNFRGTRRLP